MASSAAERRVERSDKSSRGASLPSKFVMRVKTSLSRVFKVVFTSVNRVTKDDCKRVKRVSKEVWISVRRLSRDSNLLSFSRYCCRGSLDEFGACVRKSDSVYSVDKLVIVGCSLLFSSLMESLL